ncbi:hypothetical protein BGP78_03005 [Pseudoalteromonas sp. MSK9-3]|uniref:glycosyltransferase n=1 Tax=Pseudoalteromonas sp. MSK9-3 TaxID=1897633 RepID=UPI000E6D0AC2|nr:glycosyltransferase [Pseudoalteromonas sp. MSK9-3]RJE75705.1 hypothetical protein BGP78_03005 [Pseudoalteromonas sp. MSK9-3]
MKICLIIPSFYPAVVYGGPIFSSLYASKELVEIEAVDLNVVTTNANMTNRLDVVVNTFIKVNGISVKYYNETIVGKLSLPLLFGVYKDIKNSDILHIQSIFSVSTAISLILGKIYKKPVLLSPRGSLGDWCLENGSKFKRLWLSFFIRPYMNNNIFHVTSEQEEGEVLKCFPSANCVVIPNGINIRDYDYRPDKKKPEFFNSISDAEVTDESYVVVSMGRIQKKKGFDILIHAFSKFHKKKTNSKLFIAGQDEGELNYLKRLVCELNLQPSVFFVGHLKEEGKSNFLKLADLFVLPSHNENFGNVYLESLASGTPILASKNTPWSSAVDFECGLWIDNSVEDTCAGMLDLYQRDHHLLSLNSRRLARNFGWDKIALKFCDVFSRLVQNNE